MDKIKGIEIQEPSIVKFLSDVKGIAMTYMKKPIQVKAIELKERIRINTREGTLYGEVGDFLIEGIEGEVYPCGKKIFWKTYEEINHIPAPIKDEIEHFLRTGIPRCQVCRKDMVRDIRERIEEFLTEGDEYIDYENFEVIPVALNSEQINKYKCPPNPAKFNDPRAKWYVSKYGKMSWELDSLNPLVLRKMAEISIQEFCNIDKYNTWIKREEKEKKALKDFGDKLKNGN